jgi:hypothetical protein
LFDGFVFFFIEGCDDDLESVIEESGGNVSKTFSKKVTHIVASQDLTPRQQQQSEAQETKVVTPEFITDSLKKGKKQREDDYAIGAGPSKKRKASGKDEEEDDDEPTATWSWQSDKGWEKYSATISAALEAAKQKGETEVRVDSQRFVDLKQMVQKRYDNKNKMRPVKREAGTVQKKQKTSSSSSSSGKTKVIKKGRAAVDHHSGLSEEVSTLFGYL